MIIASSNPDGTCRVPHCEKIARTTGLCASHYNRKIRGNPDWAERTMYEKPIEERFWEKVNRAGPTPDYFDPLVRVRPGSGACWQWAASTNRGGYGQFRWPSLGVIGAHRISYFLKHGKWSGRGESSIDHLCRNRACVNPAHLELVTERENAIRGGGPTGVNSRKSQCIHGHALVESNIYWENGGRKCRACRREKALAWYYRNRERFIKKVA